VRKSGRAPPPCTSLTNEEVFILSMIRIDSDEQLNSLLTQPNEADVAFARQIRGDTMVLGAGGKMGPTLAQRLLRALRSADRKSRVIAVSRFQSPDTARELAEAGVETISCDLLDADALKALPRVENVLFLAGRKFGSAGDPEVTWAMNTVVPAQVAQHFRDSRIVAFSTGNVYAFVSPEQGGCVESDVPAPLGEYAQSCLGRERIFEFYSKKFKTPCLIFRLNYAVDLRYGVLVDIARQVYQGKPVDLSVPAVNVLWQGDANSYAMRSLELCESPARILNVAGPETIQVLDAAEFFARRFQRELLLKGESKGLALLSNAGTCHAVLGYPSVSASELMEAVAGWVESGGASLNKATKFQVMDGRF
jgi:nucleoside-diphosphate-sugar epimerase